MPTRNNISNLKIAIDSLQKSTDYPFRLIIIGNCTDGTEEYVRSLGIEYIHQESSSIEAMNHGMKLAEDDVLLTHDDMIFERLYETDWLDVCVRTAKDKKVGLITTLNGGGVSGPDYLDGLNWVGTWFCFVPKHVIDDIGYLDDTFKIGEDIDYSYRAQQAGYKVSQVPRVFPHTQKRDTPHTPQDEKIIKEAGLKFRKKHGL